MTFTTSMLLLLENAIVLGTFASTALAHGVVSGIVANGGYTQGWPVSFYYDIVNKITYPQTPGWYEDALDSGFIAPAAYQYVSLYAKTISSWRRYVD
jgi:lytic cellulose monooxygenase (C1-hydroxylating)